MKIQDPSSNIKYGIVIPAYNEASRIMPTISKMIKYFDSLAENYRILVVDDGSNDQTSDLVSKLASSKPQVMLIRHENNSGKGYAVKTGMLNLKADYLLYADADGATPIEEFASLLLAIKKGADLAFGSRAMPDPSKKVETLIHRKIFGRIFNFFVSTLATPGINDTQCGFKLFTYQAAQYLFNKQTLMKFSFDVEILYLAKKAGYKMKEVPVNWNNIDGTKVRVVKDGLSMLKDVLLLRLCQKKYY